MVVVGAIERAGCRVVTTNVDVALEGPVLEMGPVEGEVIHELRQMADTL